ncbi:Rhodopsin kinase GRK7 [Labeo rohita]|uniref:Rhodopsin kinase GRK7 n=1 Tax=Labeo rohita TaxID=84645 RepID=A0ABQ8LNR5_LABRO|nr:Rhodopsin kinase GRK7 [Labeo rohita]
MVSQFGSLGYTIMGKTADLTVVQKIIIDTLHKEGKPQTFIAKEAGCSQSAVSKHVNIKLSGRKTCERKRCTTNRENRGLERLVRQNQFKNLATPEPQTTSELRRRRNGLLPSGPKSCFQMRASLYVQCKKSQEAD